MQTLVLAHLAGAGALDALQEERAQWSAVEAESPRRCLSVPWGYRMGG